MGRRIVLNTMVLMSGIIFAERSDARRENSVVKEREPVSHKGGNVTDTMIVRMDWMNLHVM